MTRFPPNSAGGTAKKCTMSTLETYQPVLGRAPAPDSGRIDRSEIEWRNGLLVRATNWLGDTLMTVPAVYRMRRAVPSSCGVFVLCPEGLAPIWEAASWVNEVITFPGKRVNRVARERIRRLRPGVAVVLPNSFGSALDIWRAGVPRRLGRRGRGRSMLLTDRLPTWPRPVGRASEHQVRRYLELAGGVGDIDWGTACPRLEISDAAGVAAGSGMACDMGKPSLVVAPGAAYGPAKQWPAERFAAVAQGWEGLVVVVGTDREKGDAAYVAADLKNVVNLAGKTSLRQLMAVLSCATCVIANDSGVMHLAAALGAHGVAIFGSTDPIATGPVGGRWIVLQDSPDCAPCFARRCALAGEDSYKCLRAISVATALEALEAVRA